MNDRGSLGRTAESEKQISVATYNIHHCSGRDRRQDPERILKIILEMNADIIGLQELDAGSGDGAKACDIHYVLESAGFNVVAGYPFGSRRGRHGNALITSHRVLGVRRIDLSVPGRQPRGAIDVDLEINGITVQVIVTHLGLRAYERRHQVRRLLDAIRRDGRPVIMLGDFNEWLPVNGRVRSLCTHLGRCPRRRTFPSGHPFLALDRIWVRPIESLVEISVHNSPAARVASDHLPLKGKILLPDSESIEELGKEHEMAVGEDE
jgi:endonuclease/exonuclease/phosphatase family metal-dependent hydrolase